MHNRLRPNSSGLDFGSGPAPVLSRMFEQAGHTMTLFDFFYHRDFAALKKEYDFITASEVVEHLREPEKELNLLWSCLKPGGHLGVMTQSVVSHESFSAWHYKNDVTHVCFYSEETFRWLASTWRAEVSFADNDVVILHKNL